MWACDFLPVVDLFFRQTFVFFVVELGSRRVVHFAVTHQPSAEWVTQQLREATPHGTGPKYLIRDNDKKYGALFDHVAEASEIEIVRTPYRAPARQCHLRALPGQRAPRMFGSSVDFERRAAAPRDPRICRIFQPSPTSSRDRTTNARGFAEQVTADWQRKDHRIPCAEWTSSRLSPCRVRLRHL